MKITLQRGQVVRSLAGHDKGNFQVVLAVEGPYAWVCDGKRRRLEKPKRKKEMHLQATNTVLAEDIFRSNRSIKNALRPFFDALQE